MLKKFRGTGAGEYSPLLVRLLEALPSSSLIDSTGKVLVQALEEHLSARKGKAGIANEGKAECVINVSSQAYVENFYSKVSASVWAREWKQEEGKS